MKGIVGSPVGSSRLPVVYPDQSYRFWNHSATFTSASNTGTSMSGPTTVAKATPEPTPNTATATAIASSKLFEDQQHVAGLADEGDLPMLGRLPLDPSIRESGEVGEPVVTRTGTEPASAFEALGEEVMDAVGKLRRESHAQTGSSTTRQPRCRGRSDG